MNLLLDALDRVLREPQCAPRWHALALMWREFPDEAVRREVLDILRRQQGFDARTDILRLTFLAGVTGEFRYESEAAVRVLAVEPPDPDRLAAFMAYQSLSALQNRDGRSGFVASLADCLLPEMARCLIRAAAAEIPPGFPPWTADEVRRVAVVVPYIGDHRHTPSLLAVEQCAVLAAEGVQVRMFSAQELTPPDVPLFRGDGARLALSPLNVQAWRKLLPAGVDMTISDSRFSLPGRWRNLLPSLADFNPDVLLLIGLYSPLAGALHKVRPVVGMNVNTSAPMAPLDVWLTSDAGADRRNSWGGVFPPAEPVFHPQRVRRSRQQWNVSRQDLGLRDGAVLWVTAGFRLGHEIRGEWASRMLQLMTRHPDVVWLLVGGDGQVPQALRPAPPGRVRALATRDDWVGLLRLCDVYVNPPRMGGGFSVAEAMAEGLPVMAFAGSDGGDKVGEEALSDMDTYVQRLAELTETPSLRAEMGERLRRRFGERLDLDASGPALVAACRRAAALATRRLTPPS